MLAKPAGREVTKSSLSLQFFLYLHFWYYWLFFVGEAAAFIHKGTTLWYPRHLLVSEVGLLVVLFVMELARNIFGRNGNLTESTLLMTMSIFLTAPCMLAYVYLLYYQTYVVKLEVVLSILSLLFIGSELALSTYSILYWFK